MKKFYKLVLPLILFIIGFIFLKYVPVNIIYVYSWLFGVNVGICINLFKDIKEK